ncbi:hypothetical protein HII36_29690 [Nonomuraea sp. NN258]|uniref:hypothetical protein n=1 Tax=Nonomuraea antri TaxID=2730852 RepID=UPI001568354A|nr:hypothetical protein [Nonomuraea antri]NRQ35974.1 hypothetical protein [Nonomuraea antri]
MDGFPDDQARITRQIQRDIVQAQTTAGTSRPLLEASAGWIFTDRTTPPTPPAGKTHIYSQGGRLWAASTAGAVPLLLPPQGPPVADVPEVDAPILGSSATVVGSDYNTIRGDLIDLSSRVQELIESLRLGDVIGT